MRALALSALLALLAAPALAADVNGLSAGVEWTAATGPVDGYDVWIQRGGVWAHSVDVSGLQAPISGANGETIKVKVRAFAKDTSPWRVGEFSQESEPITFHSTLGEPSQPTVKVQCRTGTAAILPDGTVVCQ